MRVEVLDEAEQDLVDGAHFYEVQEPGLGQYFLDSLFSDVDSLQLYAGIHPVHFGYHRLLSKRFRMRSTTEWRATSPRCGPSLTAGRTRRGSSGGSRKVDHDVALPTSRPNNTLHATAGSELFR